MMNAEHSQIENQTAKHVEISETRPESSGMRLFNEVFSQQIGERSRSAANNEHIKPSPWADHPAALPEHLFVSGKTPEPGTLSQEQIEKSSKPIVDTIAKSGNLGDEAQRRAFRDLLVQAEAKNSLPALIRELNRELAEGGLDFYRVSEFQNTVTSIPLKGGARIENHDYVYLLSLPSGQTLDQIKFQTKRIDNGEVIPL